MWFVKLLESLSENTWIAIGQVHSQKEKRKKKKKRKRLYNKYSKISIY